MQEMEPNIDEKTKITIGIPVYNGEIFIRKTLDGLLSQTFTDFKIIISDNASTDSTPSIIREYLKEDKRIKYVRHDKNRGSIWNFNFVLRESKSKYFMWAATDDVWDTQFIEKNIQILETNNNFVGSVSEIGLFRDIKEDFKSVADNPNNKNSIKYQYAHPALGSFEEKVKTYLKFFQASSIYGIYRTDSLKKSIIDKEFAIWDLAVILNVLKFGDLNVIDEVLMYRFVNDRPSKSIINEYFRHGFKITKVIFLNVPFTVWCVNNLGLKIFMKNLPVFIKLNFLGLYVVLSESVRMCKRMVFRQEKFWM